MSKATCERCDGLGYRIGRTGSRAEAAVCDCQETCELCGGSGFTFDLQDGYEVAVPCTCSRIPRRVRLFNEAGLPAKYGDMTVEDFVASSHNKRLKNRLMRFRNDFDPADSRGVVLVGDPGVGKTHLLCGLINHLTLEQGVACAFVDFFTLAGRIRATFDQPDTSSEEAILAPLTNVTVLAIDELGKGRGTTWEWSIIDQLVGRRYNAGRPILATSNYMPERLLERASEAVGRAARRAATEFRGETLEERVGTRIVRRLEEMCDFYLVKADADALKNLRR